MAYRKSHRRMSKKAGRASRKGGLKRSKKAGLKKARKTMRKRGGNLWGDLGHNAKNMITGPFHDFH